MDESGFSKAAEGAGTLVRALLVSATIAGGASSSGVAQEPLVLVQERLDAGDLAGALRASEKLQDPQSRAEWRFHVLYAGGDLPGALAAAREGIAVNARHPALLVNATTCALALNEAAITMPWTSTLSELAALPDEPWMGFRARVGELQGRASVGIELERRGKRGVVLARAVSAVALLCAGAALRFLSKRSAPRRATLVQ